MSDVALARKLVADIAGDCWGGKGDMIDRVYEAICTYFRERRQKHGWTRRRVKALWHREAALVKFHEMIELAAIAEAERAERDIKEARQEHADYIAKTAALRTLLERTDADFHSPSIEGLGRFMGGVDRAGDRR